MAWAVDYVPLVSMDAPSAPSRFYPRGSYTILPQGAVYRHDDWRVYLGQLGAVALPPDLPAFELREGFQTIVYPEGA